MAAIPDPITRSGQSVTERLLVRVQTAWQDLGECTEQISKISVKVQPPGKTSSLKSTRNWYEETTRLLLIDPVQKFLQRQPIRSTLEAIHESDQEAASASIRSRARIDARFQRLLTLAALDLCEPIRIWRGGNLPSEWEAWERRRTKHSSEASSILERYTRWAQRATSAVAKADLKPNDLRSDGRWRQHRALIATMEIEVALRDLTLAWFDSVEEFTIDVQREREDLFSYAGTTLQWLEAGAQPGSAAASESFGVVVPEERMRRWALRVEAEANRALPEKVDLLTALRRPRLHSSPARAAFLKTFDRFARTPMRAISEQLCSESVSALRKVEQAKEIIVYWSETSSNRPAEATDLMAEARQNAISTLTEQTQTPVGAEQLETSALNAFHTWNGTGLVVLEAELYGWIALLRQPRGRALSGTLVEMGRLKGKSALHLAGRWTSGQVDRTMESLGGRIPARPTLPPVVRRTTLRDTLSLPAAATSDLPALYRLLFRMTPVEDPRFLVGRDQELAGLAQAINDWETGRFAACLLIGARGSGKTSLLNCATREIFAGKPWIRAKFHERISSPASLDNFLCKLLNLPEGTDLEAALRAERRILILEEAERIYLRRVGGFAAVHRLAHLIHHTASATLWLVVMNDRSFRVLDAATHLHRVFSHRVNAMSVSRTDLESAILERHRLSGLRLEFAPPPAEDPRVNRVKRLVGLEDSAQKLFFDSLFQQSEGIFRSAFQLWLSSIERADGGTIKIRQPLDAAFTRFRSELAQQDQFTLLVIQEHGSLTRDELAQVLCESIEHSSGRMERLAELGLLEHDPEHPGPRVHPEAQRFVNDLLRRANLT